RIPDADADAAGDERLQLLGIAPEALARRLHGALLERDRVMRRAHRDLPVAMDGVAVGTGEIGGDRRDALIQALDREAVALLLAGAKHVVERVVGSDARSAAAGHREMI